MTTTDTTVAAGTTFSADDNHSMPLTVAVSAPRPTPVEHSAADAHESSPCGTRHNGSAPVSALEVEITTRAFDHTGGGDYPGSRGILIEATRPGAPGFAFSNDFPSVFVTDNGEVDINGYRYPAADLLAWMDAIAPLIRDHTGAGSGDGTEAAS